MFTVFQLRQQNGNVALCFLKDEALLTYSSLLFPFMRPTNWRHSFHFAQVPNCNPVLQRTCSFFYLHANGTSGTSLLQIIPLLPAGNTDPRCKRNEMNYLLLGVRWETKPPSPKSGEPPIPFCCQWTNLYWVIQKYWSQQDCGQEGAGFPLRVAYLQLGRTLGWLPPPHNL